MPVAVRPSWKGLTGRDWSPVCDEPQSTARTYTEGNRILSVVHMPGGSFTSQYRRNEDGSRGRFEQSYWLPEDEADWPSTKKLIESVT